MSPLGASRTRRIGLFGGSFNPPHLAHRALAELALADLGLDELRWLPAGQPWQKPPDSLAPAAHREAMVRLAAAGEPRFVVDTRELLRAGPSTTIASVRELQAEAPGASLVLVIGQDQYARLHTWVQWRELLGAVTLAVAARGGQAVQPSAPVAATRHRVRLLALPAMAISATEIRARAARGQPTAALAGEAVARYIEQHHLYLHESTPH